MNAGANTLGVDAGPALLGDALREFWSSRTPQSTVKRGTMLSGAALALVSAVTTLPPGVQGNFFGAALPRHVQTIATLHRPHDEEGDDFDFVELSSVNQPVLDFMKTHAFTLADVLRIQHAVASVLGHEPVLEASVAVDPEEGWSKLVLRFLTGQPDEQLLAIEESVFARAVTDSGLAKALRLPVIVFD